MTDNEPSTYTSGSSLWKFADIFDSAFEHVADPLRKSDVANHVFYSASAIADHSLIWFISASALGLKRSSSKKARVLAAALAADSALVNLVVKTLFNRQRPTYQGERPLPLRQPLTSSFPSGHASAAFLWATIMSGSSWIDPPYLILASVVSYSRIHVRIHHASDVIGGALIGTAVGKILKETLLGGRNGHR